MTDKPLIDITGLAHEFKMPGNGTPFVALDVPTLQIRRGERVALIGPSGSGKTTLLNIIAGLLTPTRGRVCVDDTLVTTLGEDARDQFRSRHIGYIFQTFQLLPAFNALENVMLAMQFANTIPPRERKTRANELLRRTGLGDRLLHRPGQLSVGEQQRVALARALANEPRLILADEPTASVDPATRRAVLQSLLELGERGITLIMATHDERLLEHFRIVSLVAPNEVRQTTNATP